ncbi:L-lactate dehydrogenase [Candidatus Microgenomates bacterium]|nr:L-lactate dehydrogenase [Candidatus Microgenomates bacterium CPR3]RIK51665.1 MAG: L-lactate dehydrogenase [Candidatus Microgenomates bacterium]
MFKQETFKVAIIGLGRVGITTAYAILLKGLATELVLFSREIEKAEGEKADLEHGMPFYPKCNIIASSNYEDLSGTDLVIFTAGCAQKPGETRLDLAKNNCAIVDALIPNIVKHAPHTLILMVANPVDIMTLRAVEKAKLPEGRVFGSGTLLDTARFRLHLSKGVKISAKSIHTYILGEHGDSSFAATSTATIGGKPILSFPEMSPEHIQWAQDQTRKDAYKIINGKGATYYGIASAVTHIVETIMRDSKKIIPLSTPLTGQYGLDNVSLSLPCILGRNGVERIIDLPLSVTETAALHNSAKMIRQSI